MSSSSLRGETPPKRRLSFLTLQAERVLGTGRHAPSTLEAIPAAAEDLTTGDLISLAEIPAPGPAASFSGAPGAPAKSVTFETNGPGSFDDSVNLATPHSRKPSRKSSLLVSGLDCSSQ